MAYSRFLIGLCGIFVFLSACGSIETATPVPTSITYGLTLEPTGFDPHIYQSSEMGIVLRQVYDTLVYRDPETNGFVAGLATQWAVSEDGLAYTFTLRQGVKFHDGTPFNAQAVAANLDRIIGLGNASQKSLSLLGPYAGYDIVDEYTIRIRLTEPFSPLLDSFSQIYLGIASPTAFNQYSNNRYQFHQVGTGPFTFYEYVPHNRITLRRNADYAWGPDFYSAATEQSVEEVMFQFFRDPPTRTITLENGTAQIMGELLPTDAQIMRGNSQMQLQPISIPGQPLQFLINTRRFPTDNLTVRQALIIGTNRNAIIDGVFQGFSPVAWGPLSASTLFYSRELRGVYAFDVGQARTLLTAAGYADTDNNGVFEINGVELELTVIVPPWGLTPEVAVLLQDQWRAIGIKTTLKPVSGFSSLLEEVNMGEYNLVAFNAFGLDPAFLSQFYSTGGANNFTGYSGTELDGYLHDAALQSDATIRQNLYAQAQRIIMEQVLVLPIRDYVNINAQTNAVSGLTFDSYGWFPLLNNVTLNMVE